MFKLYSSDRTHLQEVPKEKSKDIYTGRKAYLTDRERQLTIFACQELSVKRNKEKKSYEGKK